MQSYYLQVIKKVVTLHLSKNVVIYINCWLEKVKLGTSSSINIQLELFDIIGQDQVQEKIQEVSTLTEKLGQLEAQVHVV